MKCSDTWSLISVCPQGTFGDSCGGKCTCENGARCDVVTGNCTCTAGWMGENCSDGN